MKTHAILLVVLLASSCGNRPSVHGTFEAAAGAMAKAKSYRLVDYVHGRITRQIEAICPDRYHAVLTPFSDDGLEIIAIGKDSWTKVDSHWQKSPFAQPDADFCREGGKLMKYEQREASGDLPRITKGGTEEVNGEPCQDWNVRAYRVALRYCIGADDLPRTMTFDTLYETFEWNHVDAITPPQ